MYKQLKRLNNFSIPKGDAEVMVEYISNHALYKLQEQKLLTGKDKLKTLFLKFGCKVFNLPFKGELKKICFETVHRRKDIDKERLKELYPEVYKDCLKTVSYNKITIK
jgi:predicted phage-related endonuclease